MMDLEPIWYCTIIYLPDIAMEQEWLPFSLRKAMPVVAELVVPAEKKSVECYMFRVVFIFFAVHIILLASHYSISHGELQLGSEK